MLSPIQERIDSFLRATYIPSIEDIVYDPESETVKIRRNRMKGRMDINLDVRDLATPSEVMERITNHPVIRIVRN